MIRAVVFDWSGTLCNDARLTLAVTNDVLQHFGAPPVDEATYRRDFQLPVENFYRPRIGPVTRQQVDAVFFAGFRRRCKESVLFPDTLPLLWLLRQRGLKLAVLSSMETELLREMLHHHQLDGLLDLVIGNAADKPLHLPGLVRQLGCAPDQCLYVGDLENDLLAARQAGVIAAAALYGYATEERLRAVGADHFFPSLAALSRWLDRDHLLATERRVIATVGGVLCRDDGAILLVRTRKWSNKYGLPGGKIDYGETMLQAYYREIREETGLSIDNATWVLTQDCIECEEFTEPRHFLLLNYFTRVAGRPEPVANYESNYIGWHPYAEALLLDLNQPTRALLESAALANLIREKRR